MGSKQLLQWEDLKRMMGARQARHDDRRAGRRASRVNNDFKGKFEDYGVAAVPEPRARPLIGGDGYMFNPKATPEKIKAGLLWLEFHEPHAGQGPVRLRAAKEQGRPVGLPSPDLYRRLRAGQGDR